jgi:hypothetical protein
VFDYLSHSIEQLPLEQSGRCEPGDEYGSHAVKWLSLVGRPQFSSTAKSVRRIEAMEFGEPTLITLEDSRYLMVLSPCSGIVFGSHLEQLPQIDAGFLQLCDGVPCCLGKTASFRDFREAGQLVVFAQFCHNRIDKQTAFCVGVWAVSDIVDTDKLVGERLEIEHHRRNACAQETLNLLGMPASRNKAQRFAKSRRGFAISSNERTQTLCAWWPEDQVDCCGHVDSMTAAKPRRDLGCTLQLEIWKL